MMTAHNKFRIMVVDDDPDICMIVENVLSDKYDVVRACNGQDAMEKLPQYEPDLIILDLVMPVMDGLKTCDAIRRHPRFQTLHVMFLSGHNTREEIASTYRHGANLFLTKPIEPDRLLRNVDVYFQNTPPPVRPKTMSLHQIRMIEQRGRTSQGGPSIMPPQGKKPAAKPVARRPHPAPPRPATPVGPNSRPRVLIVEDDADFASLVSVSLSEHFEVVWARDGIDGIEKIGMYQPDILLVDVMLPKMNGYQLCQSVRSNPTLARLPLVFMTAKGEPKDREYATRLGADAYLVKPFDMDEIVRVCQAVTRKEGFVIHPKKHDIAGIRAAGKREEDLKQQRETRFDRPGRID